MVDSEKKKIQELQMYQQQYQSIAIQKEQIKLQKMEAEKSIEELDLNKGEKVYKIAGSIMIKKDPEDAKKELQEKVEDLDLRLKTLAKAEERLIEKLKEWKTTGKAE